jgi:uncharacterized protein DUF1320
MPYFTRQNMTGLVPDNWLVDGTDDAAEGTPSALAEVMDGAENAINAGLGGRYALPLNLADAALAAVVREIGVCLAAEALFIRRNVGIDKDSLLAGRIKRATARLTALGNGTDPLSVNTTPAHPAGMIIAEDSRVSSSSLPA